MNMDTHKSGSTVKKRLCKTENFVPIVVPGFISEFFLKFAYFNTHDFFRSGNYHTDHHPAIESSEIVDRQPRGDRSSSETSEEL